MKSNKLFILPALISLVVASQSLLNETWRQQKRVLISSHYGGYSHAKPMFQIGATLRERGHEITFVSYDPFIDLAKPWGFERITMGAGSLNPADLRERLKEKSLRSHMEILEVVDKMWKISYSTSYSPLVKIFTQEKPDLVMCDFYNFGCIDAAHHLGIPFTVQIPSLAILYTESGYVSCSLDVAPTVKENSGILGRLQSVLHRVKYLWSQWRYSLRANEDRIRNGGIPRKEFGFNNMDKGVILANSFFGLESHKYLPPNVHLIGPLISREYLPLSPELQSFLDERQKVVYIAFGTIVILDMISVEKMLRSVLHLLNKGVIDGVIWPLSQTSEDDFPREIHFDNSTIPIEKILNNEYNNIRILTFGPQFSILSHPNTVLFVSHGGLDSSNEAILTGTKVLNIPIFGDHFYNSGNLETVGVSIPMELKTFTSPEMIEKMTLLVEDKDRNFEKNVRHMQILAHINSRRINNAADVAEQLIYTKKSVNLSNRLYQRAESRMSFWEVHNYDVYFIILTTFVGLIYIFAKSAVWFMDTLNPSIQSTKVKNL